MSNFEEDFSKFCDDHIARNNKKCVESGCEFGKFSFECKKCRECGIGKDTMRIHRERGEVLGMWF